MKKLFTLMLVLAIGFGLKAQCPLTQAIDFTATDCHGTEVHLFDILDSGQAVLIDFFFTTCVPCQQATPKVVESYYAMGCNMHDVFYMEISDRDSDAACQNWCQNYGVEYPTISGAAGGSTICGPSMYNIPAYPTVILIMPDRSIVIQDLWPISSAQTVISALEQHGLQQHDCNATNYDPHVDLNIDEVTSSSITATFTPNQDCASYYYLYGSEAQFTEWIAIFGQDLIAIIEEYGIVETTTQTVIFNDLFPETEYAVVALPVDPDGNYGDYSYEIVTTSAGGGSDIIPDFTTTDIEGNEIHLYDILDAGQAVFINFFLYGDEYSETPMEDIIEAYHLYGCNTHDVFFMEITPNGTDANCQAWVERFGVEYPTISRDGGGNDIAQSIPVGFYPTLMLVRPDHTIAMRDIYPPTLEYIIDAFEGEGYMQYPCLEETLTFSTNTVNLNWAEMAWVTVYNNTAEDATITSICDDFYWLEFSLDGQDMFSCNFPVEFTIPQGESVELGILCMVVGKSIVPDLVTISSNLPDAHFTVMVDDTWSVAENEASFTLFPNPANDFVTLKGENLGTVRVYNVLGQKMDEFEANGSELRINTAGYAEGVYVVKAGEKTLRFVVRH